MIYTYMVANGFHNFDLDDTLQILQNDEFDFVIRVLLHDKVIYFKVTRSIFSLMSKAECGSSVYLLFVAIFNNTKD